MREEDKWPAIHAYRRAVVNGDAEPIRCPDCEMELVSALGHDGGPVLRCLSCRAVYRPGLHIWNQIENAIRELNVTLRERRND